MGRRPIPAAHSSGFASEHGRSPGRGDGDEVKPLSNCARMKVQFGHHISAEFVLRVRVKHFTPSLPAWFSLLLADSISTPTQSGTNSNLKEND
jgi:hypothetical protein